MKFIIGDIVQFIDEVGKGIVVEIVDKSHVLIEDENGFSYPVKIDEIMLLSQRKVPDISSDVSERSKLPVAEIKKEKDFLFPIKKKYTQFSAIDIILAFVPVSTDLTTTEMDLFLINDSNYSVVFQISANIDNYFQKIFSGELEANTQIHLTSLKKTVLFKISKFLFQGIIVLDEFQKPFPVVDKTINLKHSKFQKPNAFKLSDYFEKKTIEYQIFHSDFFVESLKIPDSEIKKQVEIKTEKTEKKQYARRHDNDLVEVDLHIHEIIDDVAGLSNSEMLAIQLNHFQKELEHALSNNIRRIVFIHGKGKGVLKNAILEKLRKEYNYLQYQDASFKEYGFGATMVFLK